MYKMVPYQSVQGNAWESFTENAILKHMLFTHKNIELHYQCFLSVNKKFSQDGFGQARYKMQMAKVWKDNR